jgi:L-rhamnose mutarotase
MQTFELIHMKKIAIMCLVWLLIPSCTQDKVSLTEEQHQTMKRVGMVVKIKEDQLEAYKKLHADDNPGVRHLLTKYHMRNFSIFLVQLADGGWYEFGYYEYWGNDLEGDMAKLDAEPENIKWIEKCDPMQEGILPGQKGWKMMDRIYYNY